MERGEKPVVKYPGTYGMVLMRKFMLPVSAHPVYNL